MPIIGGVVLLIQLCFAYHALKTGRPYWWLFVIMAFPVMGCVLYYFIEVFPNSRESRKAEKAARAVAKAWDPERTLREKVADLESCGSVENRVQLARACINSRMYADAASLYRSCLNGVYESDPEIRFGLASAHLLNGSHSEALAIAQKLRETHPAFRTAEVGMALAKSHEGAGNLDAALAEYKVLADTYPGEEGRWRYAALLARLNRGADAQDVLHRMLRNAERMPGHYHEAQGEWLKLARQHLQA
ncbi:MAG TPA: tetratricopeptide repeat protein [Burkholderiales bacterium]|jgi:hypothetical protein